MRNRSSILVLVALAMAVIALPAQAQYLTSTRAGFVNNIEGKVYVLRQDSENGEKGRASMGTQLRDGDQLSTNAGSRAELLLNPGSYLRLGENAEIRAVHTDFESVRFEVLKGSVIVEIGQIDKKFPIEIATPNGVLTLGKDTLLRIDVLANESRVSVRQGDVIASNGASKISHGKVAMLKDSSAPELAKLDKDQSDSFDLWSFNRAQTLTAANVQALRRTPTYTAFAGGWYFNPFYNTYTYIPFRGQYFSPYGFGFFNTWADCYWYNPYAYNYYPGYWGRSNNGGTVVTNGGGTGLPPRVVTGADRAPIRREPIGRTLGNTGSILDSGRGGFDSGVSSSRAVSLPASSPATTTIAAPSPSRGDVGGSRGGGSMPSRP